MPKFKNRKGTNRKGGRGKRLNQQVRNATAIMVPLNNRREKVILPISVTALIYAYTSSGDYSFSASSDVRFYAFSNIASGSLYSDITALYKNVKIISASVLVCPFKLGDSSPQGMLAIGCDPNVANGSVGNPTNGIAVNSETVRYFSPNSTIVDRVDFRWKGIGTGQNLILNELTTLPGMFYIANSGFSYVTSTTPAFDVLFSLQCEFSDVY
jgi:hypothetical protein